MIFWSFTIYNRLFVSQINFYNFNKYTKIINDFYPILTSLESIYKIVYLKKMYINNYN